MVGGRDGEASARALAEQWKVEYIDAGAVTVDPRALSLLAPSDARRLRAVPLALRGSTGLIAVAEPGDERFAAVRELTGPETKFAVVSEQTLEALLASRLFAERRAAPAPQPAREPAPAAAPIHPPVAPRPVQAPPPEPTRPAAKDDVVDAVVAAVLERLTPPSSPALDTAELDRAREALRETQEELAAAKAALEQFASQPAPPPDTAELDRAREALRETKEELAAANAEIDQNRQRIRALETELDETRDVAEKASARLREVARLLLPSEEDVSVEP